MSDNPLKGVGVVGGDKEKLRRMDNVVRLRCKSYACVNLKKRKTVKCKLRLQRCVSLIKDHTCFTLFIFYKNLVYKNIKP